MGNDIIFSKFKEIFKIINYLFESFKKIMRKISGNLKKF